MKVHGNGQAALLSSADLQLLFSEGFTNQRDRALFGICLYTACRISEALQLQRDDVSATHILFRKSVTKGRIAARELRIVPSLSLILADYSFRGDYLFPARCGVSKTLSRNTADKTLKLACSRLGIKGVSTHSFRRTALTTMSSSGIPLRTIQKISGHRSLEELERYLSVSEEQIYDATLTLSFSTTASVA